MSYNRCFSCRWSWLGLDLDEKQRTNRSWQMQLNKWITWLTKWENTFRLWCPTISRRASESQSFKPMTQVGLSPVFLAALNKWSDCVLLCLLTHWINKRSFTSSSDLLYRKLFCLKHMLYIDIFSHRHNTHTHTWLTITINLREQTDFHIVQPKHTAWQHSNAKADCFTYHDKSS